MISVEGWHVHRLRAHVVIDLTSLCMVCRASGHGAHPLGADAEVMDVLSAVILLLAVEVDFGVFLARDVYYRVNTVLHIQVVILVLHRLQAQCLLIVLRHQTRLAFLDRVCLHIDVVVLVTIVDVIATLGRDL